MRIAAMWTGRRRGVSESETDERGGGTIASPSPQSDPKTANRSSWLQARDAPQTARMPCPSTPSAPQSARLIKVSHVSQPIRADLFDQIRIISSVQNPMALSSHP